MRFTPRPYGLAIMLTATLAVGATAMPEWQDPSRHKVEFVAVDDGVRLEVLDWGGSGKPVVLLPGLRFTSHVFDGFAKKLGLATFIELRASAAVQIEVPSKTRSLIRNWPASPSKGIPCENWNAPGVEKRKLTVNTNVIMAPMLPKKASLAEKGRKAISRATTISVTPIRLETPWTLKIR